MKRTLLAVVVLLGLAAAYAAYAVVALDWIEISAPIVPAESIQYQYEGQNFPATLAQEEKVALDSALVYEQLLVECAPKYPDITLQAAGAPPLTAQQLAQNYTAVAKCSYESYVAKPYWIPQLVDDVDICGKKLGADWHLLSEKDVAGLSDTDFAFIAKTMTGTNDGLFGSYYASTHAYVRASDGTLKFADLGPGVTDRIKPFPAYAGNGAVYDPKVHLEGDITVRCVRVTSYML